MVLFYILLLFPILMQHCTIGGIRINREKKKKKALAFFFVLLAFMVMFRHETVGSDTLNYRSIYERISGMSWDILKEQSAERGFLLYCKILSLFSREPQFFLAATALITTAMIYSTYKRLCTDPSLTIVLFCIMSTFVLMFSGVKQMLACGIGMVAYEYVRKNKILPFFLCVFAAMAIHSSAFMVAFMYPLYHVRITRKWLYFVVPVIVAIFVFNQAIFSFLLTMLSQFTEYEGKISATGAYTMLLLFAFFAVFAFLVPEESSLDQETIGMRNFLLFSLVLQMFAPLHTLAMRMNYYYLLFIPLLLPKIIACRSWRWNQVAIWGRDIMVVFFLLYFFMNAYGGGNLRVFPYHFCWENVT